MTPEIFSRYFGSGKTIQLSEMTLAIQMIYKIHGSIDRIRGIYREIFEIDETLTRLDRFYRAPEIQKGLINKNSEDSESEYAITMKGNFSWGINSVDKE